MYLGTRQTPIQKKGLALQMAANGFMFLLLLLSNQLQTTVVVSGQDNGVLGVSVCACTPRSYQFTFTLTNASCDNNDNIVGDGVLSTECSIAPFQSGNTNTSAITDRVPVSVETIDILELDTDLVFITQTSKFGNFSSNDTFEFVSITNNLTAINISTVPKAIQISMLGRNSAGESLFFQALIIYSIDCTIFPIIEPGTSIGWITLVRGQKLFSSVLII
jgi:hypothetical protein